MTRKLAGNKQSALSPANDLSLDINQYNNPAQLTRAVSSDYPSTTISSDDIQNRRVYENAAYKSPHYPTANTDPAPRVSPDKLANMVRELDG